MTTSPNRPVLCPLPDTTPAYAGVSGIRHNAPPHGYPGPSHQRRGEEGRGHVGNESAVARAAAARQRDPGQAIPEGEFGKISERVELIELDLREQVYQPGQAIHQVYFPTSAVFSLMAVGDEQASVEVATVGVEGMVGLPLFLGANTTPHAGFCQILRAALRADGQLHRLLNRFVHATIVQIAQNVVCNNSHSVEQRAARWLLTTRDRVNGDQFPLTQEFLAQMLGVRQPTVSDTAGPGPHPISSRDHHHTRPRGFGGARLPLLPGRPPSSTTSSNRPEPASRLPNSNASQIGGTASPGRQSLHTGLTRQGRREQGVPQDLISAVSAASIC